MASENVSEAQRIRASLKHPVIDVDGHWLEFGPIIVEQLEKFGGSRAVEGFRAFNGRISKRLTASEEERKRRRRAQEAFWALPTKNTRDRATEILPRLLYQRLDEFGMDFTVLYPTAGLGIPFHPDDETRRATCRAFNRFIAGFFGEFSDRMTPAAVIPMHTPEEACAELEYVVKELGLKVVMMASMVRRQIPAESVNGRATTWFDMLGLDSEYNYDPVWAKCIELGISPTFHSGSRGVWAAQFADQFCLQPYRAFRRRERSGVQGDFLRGRHAPLSATQDGVSRRRSRMGVRALLRSDRTLEEAQSRGARGNESRQPESRHADATDSRVRRKVGRRQD
jgi:hypothetical protein